MEGITEMGSSNSIDVGRKKDDDDDETTTREDCDDELTWQDKTKQEEDEMYHLQNRERNTLLRPGRHINDDWKIVLDKLKKSGWTWKRGRVLHTFYFIKPGSTVKEGKEYED